MIDAWLAEARTHLTRIQPADLEATMERGALVVDTRDTIDRLAEGELPGAIVIPRNLLEWRVAPSAELKDPRVDTEEVIVVVCNDGFSSSIAAVTLQLLGVPRATDLAGGFRAWAATRPDD